MLRARFSSRRDVGYAGADFRVYGYMRVADAVRFYSAIHARWDAAQLAEDLQATGLGLELEVRRMKTVYQRALVLALVSAARPDTLVIERAEQFDVPAAVALLERAVRRAAQVIATYAADAVPAEALFDVVSPANEYAAAP